MGSSFPFSYSGHHDSAISLLPPSSPSSSRSTHVSSSAIAASSTATSYHPWPNSPSASYSTHVGSHVTSDNDSETPDAPWSQVNTRFSHASSSSQWQPALLTPAPTFDDFDPRGYHPQALVDNLASIESKLGYSIPDETTTDRCPPATSLPQPWAAASNATATSTLATSDYNETALQKHTPSDSNNNNNTIRCGQCGIGFNGAWRRGNLNRHVKLKHTASRAGPYTCVADGCYKVFARSDARIKHMRKHHPDLLSISVHRRHGHEKEPSTLDTASTYHPDFPSGPWTSQDFETGFTVSPPRYNEAAQAYSLNASRVLCSYDTPHGQAGVKRTSTTDTQDSSTSSLELTVGQWVPHSSACENPTVSDSQQQQQLQREVTVEELPLAARIVFGSLYVKLDVDDYSRFCDAYFGRWARLLNQLRRKQSDAYVLYAQVVQDLRAVVDAIDAGAVDLTNFGSAHHSGRPHPDRDGNSHGFGGSNLGLGGTGAGSPPGKGSKPGGRKASKSIGPGNDARVSKKSTKKSNQRGVSCPEYKHWWMRRHDPSIPRPTCNDCCVAVMSQLRNHINRNNHGNFHVTHCQTCETDFVTRQAYDDHVAAESCDHVPQFRNNIVTSWARLYIMKYPNATQIPNPYSDERGWLNNTIVAECRSWYNNTIAPAFLGSRQGHNAPPRPPPATIPVNDPLYNDAMTFAIQDAVAPSPIRNTDPDAAALSESASRLAVLSPRTPAQRERFRRQLQGISARYFQALILAPHFVTSQELTILADGAEAAAHQIHTLQESQPQQNQTQTHAQLYLTPRRQPSSRAGRSTQPSTRSLHTGSSLPPGSYHTRPSSVNDPDDLGHQSPLPPGMYQRPVTSPQAPYHRSGNQNWPPYPQALQYQQGPLYQHVSPYQLAPPFQYASPSQQASPPYQQAGSPFSTAESLYSPEGLGQQPPWNLPQSPQPWQQDMQAYSPGATFEPFVFSPSSENDGTANDRVRRPPW